VLTGPYHFGLNLPCYKLDS